MSALLQVLCLALSQLAIAASSASEAESCTICRVLVTETNWVVNHRVGQLEKNFDTTLVEDVLDDICGKFNQYAQLTQEDGSQHIVRTRALNGSRLQMDYLDLDERVGSELAYKCDDFLEDHYKGLVGMFQTDDVRDLEKVICGQETGVCDVTDLDTPMVTLPPATGEEHDDDDDDEDEDGDIHHLKDDPTIHQDPVVEEDEEEETVFEDVTVNPQDVDPIYLLNEHVPDNYSSHKEEL